MTENYCDKNNTECAKKEQLAKDAPILGKWLWLLFWLIVPSSIVSLISADSIGELYPKLYFIGQILSAGCSALYGFILLQLVKQEPMYKTAGILVLITSAVSAVLALISGLGEIHKWTLLISLPAAVAAFAGEYYEFMAHSFVVNDVDRELAMKWERLWKWYIRCYIAIIAAIAVTIIIPAAAIIILFGAAIGIAVVSIMKLVYVYRTAKLFREYSDV